MPEEKRLCNLASLALKNTSPYSYACMHINNLPGFHGTRVKLLMWNQRTRAVIQKDEVHVGLAFLKERYTVA